MKYTKYGLFFGLAFGIFYATGPFSMIGFLLLWLAFEWRKPQPQKATPRRRTPTYIYYPMPPMRPSSRPRWRIHYPSSYPITEYLN